MRLDKILNKLIKLTMAVLTNPLRLDYNQYIHISIFLKEVKISITRVKL